MTKKKRTARTRLSRGVFVSLCLVATIVLAVGTGIFSQRALEQQVLSDNSGTNLSESVAEVNIAEEEQPEPLEITSDAEYGDYEKGRCSLRLMKQLIRSILMKCLPQAIW